MNANDYNDARDMHWKIDPIPVVAPIVTESTQKVRNCANDDLQSKMHVRAILR